MKKSDILYLIVFCSFLATAPQSIMDKESWFKEKVEEKNLREEKLLEEWRIDSFGCLGHRKLETIIFIIDTLNIKDKSTDFVIEKLGYPNARKQGLNSENFYYYFDVFCNGNVFNDSLDFCWFELLMEFDQVTAMDVSCN